MGNGVFLTVQPRPYRKGIAGAAPRYLQFCCTPTYIALRPPSISDSSTMGEAILLGACLTGLQGLRGPLGWQPAEAAGSNDVVSKATGVDIATGSRLPREPEKTTFFIVINYTTISS